MTWRFAHCQSALPRRTGASAAQVSGSQRAEFLAMGLVAGLLATAGAAAISVLLAQRVFQLELPANYLLWVFGPLAGVALLSLNAWLSSRKVLNVSPSLSLVRYTRCTPGLGRCGVLRPAMAAQTRRGARVGLTRCVRHAAAQSPRNICPTERSCNKSAAAAAATTSPATIT